MERLSINKNKKKRDGKEGHERWEYLAIIKGKKGRGQEYMEYKGRLRPLR